jgi:hypothetical protein
VYALRAEENLSIPITTQSAYTFRLSQFLKNSDSNPKAPLQLAHNKTSREIISTAILNTLIALQMMSLYPNPSLGCGGRI